LGPGRRFLITTPDAEVEVKGTRFEVAVGPEPSTCAPHVRTRVTVQEGLVAVRFRAGEVQLAAGATWPACGPEKAASSDEPAAVSPAPARQAKTGVPRAAVAMPPVAPRPAPATPASTLAEQNDLFAAALAASRRGDTAEALDWLDRLLARYPNGQLVDSARAERRRLLQAGARREPAE
jgi:ferric-dicitrate binding protein FerR (iron transport regulator)